MTSYYWRWSVENHALLHRQSCPLLSVNVRNSIRPAFHWLEYEKTNRLDVIDIMNGRIQVFSWFIPSMTTQIVLENGLRMQAEYSDRYLLFWVLRDMSGWRENFVHPIIHSKYFENLLHSKSQIIPLPMLAVACVYIEVF